MSDHVIEPMGGLIDAAVNAAVESWLHPEYALAIADSALDSIDRKAFANSLVAKLRALRHLDPLPMGDMEGVHNGLIVRILIRRSLMTECIKKHPGWTMGDCKKQVDAVMYGHMESIARQLASEQGHAGVLDIWDWLLSNWQKWLPALLTLLIALL